MLISSLILLLLSNAVSLRKDKSILYSRFAILSLIFSSIIGLNSLHIRPLEKGIGIYGGLFNVTLFSQTFHLFIFVISSIILVLTAFYPRIINLNSYSDSSKFDALENHKPYLINKTGEQFRIIEYPLIIMFIITGAVFLISAGDLISIFLSIELQSYGLYILSTLYRDSESATASGLTYFLLGGLSSCFILLGSALLYNSLGSTSLDNIYLMTLISEMGESGWYHNTVLQQYNISISLIIMFVGFLFKVSAAPFHFWSPDVYDGIPTIVTTYVAIVAKISLFAFFLEIVYYTDYYYFEFSWKTILLLSSLLSLIIGSLLGLTQFRIKRLFAYSTISHVGFVLLALSIGSIESTQSFIFYLLQYSIANLNAFIILVCIGFSLYIYIYKDKENKEERENLIDRNNSPIQLINQVKGYFHINPFISVSLAITIFSFIGVPPMIGFFAKQMILSAALDNGYVFMALVAILTSVIGAGYYLNLIKQIFFYKENYKINPSITKANPTVRGYTNVENTEKKALLVPLYPVNITLNKALSGTISIITLLLVLFIFMPEEWYNIIAILTLITFKA